MFLLLGDCFCLPEYASECEDSVTRMKMVISRLSGMLKTSASAILNSVSCAMCVVVVCLSLVALFFFFPFYWVMKMLANAVRSVSGECQFSTTTAGNQKQ